MFDRIRILRSKRGFKCKNCIDFKEEPSHITHQLASSESQDEHQDPRQQETADAPKTTEVGDELLSTAGNVNHRIEKIQERAIMQGCSSQHSFNTCVASNLSTEKVLIVNATPDNLHAQELAKRLRDAGCRVFPYGEIEQNHFGNKLNKTLKTVHNIADFVVFIVTESFISQLYHKPENGYNRNILDRKINYMYRLAYTEFSEACFANYRVRPVCLNYEVANKVGNDAILKYCYRLNDEVPKLVANLKNTKKFLLDSQTQFSKRQKTSTKIPKRASREQWATSENLAEDKVALLIANQSYEHPEAYEGERLTTPAKDVNEIAEMLHSMNFKVIVVKDLTKKEMENVIHSFCSILVPGSYALFFFAGHGCEVWGKTYLLPVDYTKFTLDEYIGKEEILKGMQERKTALNVLFLDCCRVLPGEARPFLDPIVANMYKNTVYVYATTFSNRASELEFENSFLVMKLKKHLCKNKSIQAVILKVQEDSHSEQYLNPVLESSLTKPYKLCDKLNYTAGRFHSIPWKINQKETFVDFPNFKCTIRLNIHYEYKTLPDYVMKTLPDYKMKTLPKFILSVYIFVWLINKTDTSLNGLLDKEINIETSSVPLQLKPPEGKKKENLKTEIENLQKNEKLVLFKQQIFNYQQMENQLLKGNILFKKDNEVIEKSEFCIWLRGD